MPKTNLQNKVSYYARIIEESKKSPLTPQYKAICDALEKLVDFSKKLNNPEVKMNAGEFAQLQDHYRATQNACRDYFGSNIEFTEFEKNRSGIMKSISRLLS